MPCPWQVYFAPRVFRGAAKIPARAAVLPAQKVCAVDMLCSHAVQACNHGSERVVAPLRVMRHVNSKAARGGSLELGNCPKKSFISPTMEGGD